MQKVRDCAAAVGQVQAILFLPDNERFAVACDTHRRSDADRSLGIWDYESGVRLIDQIYPVCNVVISSSMIFYFISLYMCILMYTRCCTVV